MKKINYFEKMIELQDNILDELRRDENAKYAAYQAAVKIEGNEEESAKLRAIWRAAYQTRINILDIVLGLAQSRLQEEALGNEI